MDESLNGVILKESLSYAISYKNVGNFLFAPSKNVAKIMRDNYRPMFTVQDYYIQNYLKTLESIQNQANLDPALALSNVRYELLYSGDSVRDAWYTPPLGSDGKPQYLDYRNILDYHSKMQDFQQVKTEGFFLPHSGDPECTGENAKQIPTCLLDLDGKKVQGQPANQNNQPGVN